MIDKPPSDDFSADLAGDSEGGGSDWHRWQAAVWDVVEEIPSGSVLTYGQVAALAGRANRARRVGQALRAAPADRSLPWHRVINAQGRVSFKPGSRHGKRQRDLLRAEGIVFKNDRIDLERYGWRNALDQLLWAAPES